MALRVVLDRKSIRRARSAIIRAFKSSGATRLEPRVGYPGGDFPTPVLWSKDFGVWFSPGTIEGSRHWNGFGTQDPSQHPKVDITCEVNFPLSGIDRRVGGAVVEDPGRNLYIAHRGRIGGGRTGIGRALFWDHFDGNKRDAVVDGDRETRMAIIGAVDSPRLARQLAFFVKEVERIKELRDSPTRADQPKPRQFRIRDFSEEFEGRRKATASKAYRADCDHGIVVNRLRKRLEALGYKVGKDSQRDLYVHKRNMVTTLFEIKPAWSKAHLYTAIGQLYLNSLGLHRQPRLVAVLPDNLPNGLLLALGELGIDVLRFNWRNDEPAFVGLDKMRF